MSAEAHITSIWKKQKLFIAVFFILCGPWFLFDGYVGFPHSNQRWLKHKEINDHWLSSVKDADSIEKEENARKARMEWEAVAKEKGWNSNPPEKFYEKADIKLQFILGTCSLLAGAGLFIFWNIQIRRILKSDDEAVYAPDGTRIPFKAITGINRKKWDSKGLATIHYSIDGRRGKFILDDYKFDRDPTHQIMAEIEEKRPRQD